MQSYYWDTQIEYLKNTRKQFWNDDYLEFLVKQVWKIDQPVNVIDFGCGFGYLGIKLMPLLAVGSTYTGIDLGGELLTNAKQLFQNAPFQTRFIKADLIDFVPAKKYDVTICQAVLRHIPQYKHVLKNMVDSTAEGGKVICIEVNRRMENAGLYMEGVDFHIDERDALIKERWREEEQNNGRDYLAGIKIPILMEELGLRDVSVRVNDFVEFISRKQDIDGYHEHINAFMAEHGYEEHLKNGISVSALNARSLLISFGTK